MTKEDIQKIVKQAEAYQNTWPEWKKKFVKQDFEFHTKKISEFYKIHD